MTFPAYNLIPGAVAQPDGRWFSIGFWPATYNEWITLDRLMGFTTGRVTWQPLEGIDAIVRGKRSICDSHYLARMLK